MLTNQPSLNNTQVAQMTASVHLLASLGGAGIDRKLQVPPIRGRPALTTLCGVRNDQA